MEKLIHDASTYTDIQKELNVTVKDGDLSFANIVNAISVVQKKLGIMGTTAKEAATTIQGSMNAMKAAWSNLLTAFADPAQDLGQALDRVIGTVNTVLDNLLVRITEMMPRLARGAVTLLQTLVTSLPERIQEVLPVLISSITDLLNTLVGVLPGLLSVFVTDILPQVASGFISLVLNVANTIIEMLPSLIEQVGAVIGELFPLILQGIIVLVRNLTQGLPRIIDMLITVIPQITESVNQAILDNFPALFSGIVELIVMLLDHLPELVEMLTDQIEPIVSTIVEVLISNLPLILEGVAKIIVGIIKALPSLLVSAIKGIGGVFTGATKGVVEGSMDWAGGMPAAESEIDLAPSINMKKQNKSNSNDGTTQQGNLNNAGVTIVMDGKKVGEIVGEYQNNDSLRRGKSSLVAEGAIG